ncbi:MAG: YajQ family cyclic di-GMP-binding protein [Magnetococcus sp. DMHC-6]
MPSFDIVSQVDAQEVENALQQTIKEITTRYDFKGSKTTLVNEKPVITITTDDKYKLEQVVIVLKSKMVRRQVDPKVLDFAVVENASGGLVRQKVTVRQGVEVELGRKIVKMIKESKLKVQAAIQGDLVRVTGKNRDDLQQVIALLKETDFDIPLQFINFRE